MLHVSKAWSGNRTSCSACPGSPLPAVTGRGLACLGSLVVTPSASAIAIVKFTGHAGPGLWAALLIAVLAILATLATALNQVFCSLVHHLPGIMRARSEARSMEWITKAALHGTCKTSADAERKRADARAFAAQLGMHGLASSGSVAARTAHAHRGYLSSRERQMTSSSLPAARQRSHSSRAPRTVPSP